MRYYVRGETLFLRGTFRAASTGMNGGIANVSTIISLSVPVNYDNRDPARDLELAAGSAGTGSDYFGFLTAVRMRNLCILQYDFITAFVTAGITGSGADLGHTITIIIHSDEGLSDGALLGSIITATEAKSAALRETGYDITGTATDAVGVAGEGTPAHLFAGPATPVGKRIYEAVRFGVPEALKRHEGQIQRERPSFFVYSRFGGGHWAEWQPAGCPYYPCHFEGQSCEYCYCPFYPCREPSLGQWVDSSSMNGPVWNCSGCTLLHDPAVAEYLRRNPEATLAELKRLDKKKRSNS